MAKAPHLPLAALQERLFNLITARDNVDETLAAQGLPQSHVTDHILGDDRLDGVGRLNIYNNMYFFRLLEDVLQADYPTVAAVLGEEGFRSLVADYLQACPSIKPSARYASERLPLFLSTWGTPTPVWLPSLAALEWARVDVFDDADDEKLTLQQAQATSDLPSLRLILVTAHRTVSSSHLIADVWRAVEHEEAPPEPAAEACTLLVWREDAMVYHRPLSADETAFWPKLQSGLCFGDLCEHLGQKYSDAEAAATAVQLLTAWLNDGLLAAR
ncbi:MAG: DNA-binding domain-containing protein [Deltaproteobacteria bacterium]|nr:DNA-binding domain-containing protein [Deltaproteobacteria bacterium]